MASKRQQESGAEKRKKKRKRDETQASLAGSMLKYVQGGSQGQDEPSSSSAIPGHQPPAIVDPATIPSQEEQEPSTTSSASTGLKEINVQADRNAQLECQGPKKGKIVPLEWKRLDLLSDGYVFFYRDGHLHKTFQHPIFRDGVELRDPQMKNGDMAIILYNTTIKDSGTYECRIITQNTRDSSSPTFEIKHEIRLTVVPPGQPKKVTVVRDEENGSKDVGNEDGREGGFIGLASGLPVLVVILIFVLSYKLRKACCD